VKLAGNPKPSSLYRSKEYKGPWYFEIPKINRSYRFPKKAIANFTIPAVVQGHPDQYELAR